MPPTSGSQRLVGTVSGHAARLATCTIFRIRPSLPEGEARCQTNHRKGNMDKTTLLKGLTAALLLTASGSASAAVSYFNDFSGASDGKWSNYTTYTTTEATPNQVLGRFGGPGAGSTLSLNALDAHSAITVEFDLYLFDSWDRHYTGTSPANPGTVNPNWNPDIVQVSVDGSTSSSLSLEYTKNVLTDLVTDSTFSQTDSGQLGGSSNWTNVVPDKVFHVSVLFTHSAPTLNLAFLSLGGHGLSDESFALDNVRVSTVVPSPSSLVLLAAGALAFRRTRRSARGFVAIKQLPTSLGVF